MADAGYEETGQHQDHHDAEANGHFNRNTKWGAFQVFHVRDMFLVYLLPSFLKFVIKSICHIEEKTEADTFHKGLDEGTHDGIEVTKAASDRQCSVFTSGSHPTSGALKTGKMLPVSCQKHTTASSLYRSNGTPTLSLHTYAQ